MNWSPKEPEYTSGNSTDGALVGKAVLRTLYDGYFHIVDDDILTHIIAQTGNYTKQKNEHGYFLSID
ncbi:hypothetical protein HPB48_006920 [Haemaphysalis longicornis]|uniref:Uncharacterized protein n=1 Tax=Haemaphysalis longicornis TaxID=44386 RepID=A0A9J6GR05_HAELO|nr:hypothetical protein HPB48_006920 [Haemaphysalis longicornis]